MSLDTPRVLIDGTFASPLVWVLVAISSLLLALPGLALLYIGRRDSFFRRVALIVSVGCGLLSPFVFNVLVALSGLSWSDRSVFICLMPTRHILRDFSPGVLSILAVYLVGRLIAPSVTASSAPSHQ